MSLSARDSLTIIILVLLVTTCTAYIWMEYSSGQALVGIRNSLIAEIGSDQDFIWTPLNKPVEFKQETSVPPLSMQQSVAELLKGFSSDTRLQVTLALSRHLSDGGERIGGGIRSNTEDAYKIIRHERRGYCSDYSQVMNGMAYIANIPVREWGMSFDAYSGDGHAFNEIFSERYSKWIFLDSFYSFYVLDAETKIPLSALEFQKHLRLAESDESITIVPIVPEHFKFRTADRALQYYRRGADQFFLYMGNNVFSTDNDAVLQAAGSVSSYLAQSLAILKGLQPEIRILPTDTNGPEIEELFANRNMFFSLVILDFSALVLLAVFLHKRYSAKLRFGRGFRRAA